MTNFASDAEVPVSDRQMDPAENVGLDLAAVRPSPRQIRWQLAEMYSFIHFGMNTMTGREWGTGDEDPALFAPPQVDTDQWMRGFVSAGMTGVILTAKHHDGFCLWPTATTAHSVASAPWRDGRGDVVREVADAAGRHGLALGIYLSPWDRNHPSYGTGTAYDDVFVKQLTELLTNYGPVFSVWFDGANGEGSDGRVQAYDWERYYAVIRDLQPEAAISVCGPDVRWCGNEAGHTRPQEWSVVPRELRNVERIADKSQQTDDASFARLVRSDDQDLGSREALTGRLHDLVWYPAEVNTSIRPGWFYHSAEDAAVRTGDELFDIWCTSVGGNANFLLNVPPDPMGRVAAPDLRALGELGDHIRALTASVVTGRMVLSSGDVRGGDGERRDPESLQEGFGARRYESGGWVPAPDDPAPWARITFDRPMAVSGLVLREDITQGQRLELTVVTGGDESGDAEIARVLCVGYQRLVRFDPRVLTSLTVRVEAARAAPRLRTFAVLAAG